MLKGIVEMYKLFFIAVGISFFCALGLIPAIYFSHQGQTFWQNVSLVFAFLVWLPISLYIVFEKEWI